MWKILNLVIITISFWINLTNSSMHSAHNLRRYYLKQKVSFSFNNIYLWNKPKLVYGIRTNLIKCDTNLF